MLPRLPPALEWLEWRLAPATLLAGRIDDSSEPVQVAVFEPVAEVAAAVALPNTPFQVFASASVATGTPTGSGQVFFSTPAPVDPQMSLIGRHPEASLEFPASGGGGAEVKSVELGYLVPAVAPVDAEQGANEGDGEAVEPPPPEVEVV